LVCRKNMSGIQKLDDFVAEINGSEAASGKFQS
jgi:hypothetical protein